MSQKDRGDAAQLPDDGDLEDSDASEALAKKLRELETESENCLTKQKECDKRRCETTDVVEYKCKKKITKVLRKQLHQLVDNVNQGHSFRCRDIPMPWCMYLSDYCNVIPNEKGEGYFCVPKPEARAEASDSDADKFKTPSRARAKAKAKAKARARSKQEESYDLEQLPEANAKAQPPAARQGGSSGSGEANQAFPLQAAGEHAESSASDAESSASDAESSASDAETQPVPRAIPAGEYDIRTCGNLAELLRQTNALSNKSPKDYLSVFEEGLTFKKYKIQRWLTMETLTFKKTTVTWPW